MIYMFNVIHFCLLMYLKILEKKCMEIYKLDPTYFLSAPGLAWQNKTKVELELLADIDMLFDC